MTPITAAPDAPNSTSPLAAAIETDRAYFELGATIERLPPPHPDPGGPPVAALARYETIAIFDPYGGCTLAGVASQAALRDLAEVAGHAEPPQQLVVPPAVVPSARRNDCVASTTPIECPCALSMTG